MYPEHIVMFRLGDFYEMFYDDALRAAPVLSIALTQKSFGIEHGKAPLCGVPYHAVDSYIAKLVEAGYKVAICEQMEDPALAKGIVRREVVRVYTPGTFTGAGASGSETPDNRWLAAVHQDMTRTGAAYMDINTGDVLLMSLDAGADAEMLARELARMNPSEVVETRDSLGLAQEAAAVLNIPYSTALGSEAMINKAKRAVERIYGAAFLTGPEASARPSALQALLILISYLDENKLPLPAHVKRPAIMDIGSTMILDRACIRGLELTERMFERTKDGSLFGILDRSMTAMGARLIKKWITAPLVNAEQINARLSATEALYEDSIIRNEVREALRAVYDLERLSGCIAMDHATPRDILALAISLRALPELKYALISLADEHAQGRPALLDIAERISTLEETLELIDNAVKGDAPLSPRNGGVIKNGYSEELDALRDGIKEAQSWIAKLEPRERERTGIKSLKVRFNKVFGYYIEVSHVNVSSVPDDYVRKQTLVNAERYITPELKEKEALVLGAEMGINELENKLFAELVERLKEDIPALMKTAQGAAEADALASFAEVAVKRGYVKPTVDDGSVIEIRRGRHPVVETTLGEKSFVPGDIYIDKDAASMLLITGPNMGGKSTYMRMCALIALMAQAGSYVPAEYAHIGVCDRVYTRIGASDDLSRGESTFYVEMSELSYILGTATDRSLVILDEIGRGTSTYDGLAIAWATVEELTREERRVRTMFATHYHELTTLADSVTGVKNLYTEIAETAQGIVFLHKVSEGSADRSYGVHVARLAGVPETLTARAEQLLVELERKQREERVLSSNEGFAPAQPRQDELLRHSGLDPQSLTAKLDSIDINATSPIEALSLLAELKELAK